MSVPRLPCPNCGQPWPPDTSICPNCGYIRPAVPAWPPSPASGAPTLPVRPQTLTGTVWGDVLLTASVQLLAHLGTARALVATIHAEPANDVINAFSFDVAEFFWAGIFGLLLYFGLRRYSAGTARGSGFVTLALLAVLLGALFTCHVVRY